MLNVIKLFTIVLIISHTLFAWGKTGHRIVGEIAEKYLDKGSSIYVEGKIQTRKWQDKDGNDRYTTEILGNQLTMLGSRNTSDPSMNQENNSDTPFPEDDSSEGITDDDIPF